MQDNSGIIVVRTATLLLVATYSPEMSPSICVEAVEKLGQFMMYYYYILTTCDQALFRFNARKPFLQKKGKRIIT